MSLQIVTVKDIKKERNRRYDTSDRYTSFFIFTGWPKK